MITIHLSQSAADEFLAAALPMLDTAAEYAEKCVDILVVEYGAKRENIQVDIFRHPAISRLMNGEPLDAPDLAVRKAVQMYKLSVLGL